MKKFKDYFDQIIMERFLATAVKREHNVTHFLDKKIIKYLDRGINVKEYDEHGFHKYKEEVIDLNDETYKKLIRYSQNNDLKVRDILQAIMDEVIWEYYLEDTEIPSFSFSFEEEIAKQNQKKKLDLKVGKQYKFTENNGTGIEMANVGDYEFIVIAMISNKFPDKYIDKDKNIKLVQKVLFNELSEYEIKKRKKDNWILLEIIKTNSENVLLWMQKENAKLCIEEY
ncbi:MAG: hypothetical protein ACOCRX_11230 [Candidatus Woesearchaeota archaeon]